MKLLTRLEIIAAIGSFALIFVCVLVRQLAIHNGFEQATVDVFTQSAVLLLFFIFAMSSIGLAFHAFVVLQVRLGNGSEPLIRFLAGHEMVLMLGVWGFVSLGMVIALPFILQDMLGLRMPIGRSRGVLTADIGMTFDEVKQRSTLKLKEPRLMGDGTRRDVETVVFDYRIGDSGMQFPQSRYYWLGTRKKDPTHIAEINIGITPQKMPKADLDAFQHRLQQQLSADGWMPGHYIATDEKTVILWSGRHTAGDGRYWLRGSTLLIFEVSRMDEQKRDEPPGSGEFILNLAIRPKSDDLELVYERSAWPN